MNPPLLPTEEVSAPVESSPDPLAFSFPAADIHIEGSPDPPSKTYTQCLLTLALDQFRSEFRSGEVKGCQRCRNSAARSNSRPRRYGYERSAPSLEFEQVGCGRLVRPDASSPHRRGLATKPPRRQSFRPDRHASSRGCRAVVRSPGTCR